MRTDELYTEINHVITTFGQPFVQLLAVSSARVLVLSTFLTQIS